MSKRTPSAEAIIDSHVYGHSPDLSNLGKLSSEIKKEKKELRAAVSQRKGHPDQFHRWAKELQRRLGALGHLDEELLRVDLKNAALNKERVNEWLESNPSAESDLDRQRIAAAQRFVGDAVRDLQAIPSEVVTRLGELSSGLALEVREPSPHWAYAKNGYRGWSSMVLSPRRFELISSKGREALDIPGTYRSPTAERFSLPKDHISLHPHPGNEFSSYGYAPEARWSSVVARISWEIRNIRNAQHEWMNPRSQFGTKGEYERHMEELRLMEYLVRRKPVTKEAVLKTAERIDDLYTDEGSWRRLGNDVRGSLLQARYQSAVLTEFGQGPVVAIQFTGFDGIGVNSKPVQGAWVHWPESGNSSVVAYENAQVDLKGLEIDTEGQLYFLSGPIVYRDGSGVGRYRSHPIALHPEMGELVREKKREEETHQLLNNGQWESEPDKK